MAQRLGVNEFECEGRCGFRGAFGAVVQHERTCPAAAATRAGGVLERKQKGDVVVNLGWKQSFRGTIKLR